MRVFRERLSICMCASFPFGFEDGVWDLIVLRVTLDHCLSFYFASYVQSTLVISTSVISNNRLSRRENLIPVIT